MVTFFLVLLLFKSTERVNIAWPGDTWEGALALPIQLKLALDLFDHHLFQCKDVHVLHFIFGLAGHFRLLIRVQVNEGGAWSHACSTRRRLLTKGLSFECVIHSLTLNSLAAFWHLLLLSSE